MNDPHIPTESKVSSVSGLGSPYARAVLSIPPASSGEYRGRIKNRAGDRAWKYGGKTVNWESIHHQKTLFKGRKTSRLLLKWKTNNMIQTLWRSPLTIGYYQKKRPNRTTHPPPPPPSTLPLKGGLRAGSLVSSKNILAAEPTEHEKNWSLAVGSPAEIFLQLAQVRLAPKQKVPPTFLMNSTTSSFVYP